MRRAAVPVVLSAALAAAVVYYHQWQHWISHATGSYDTPGTAHHYNYNSGFGSIIESVGLTWAGVGVAFWWPNQCHVGGCYWYARHVTAAGDRVCWRHNPQARLTADEVRKRHHLYLGKQPGRG